MKRAFTLLEVNLAIMILAGGVLSIMGLYGLGYRERSQSREDVASAAYADAVISPLVAALSSTNVTWQAFNSIDNVPGDGGWGEYLNFDGSVKKGVESKARGAFENVVGKVAGGVSWPSSAAAGGLKGGLVILHSDDSAIVRIGFRAARHEGELMSMPMFYTEVRFQGITER